MWLKNIFSSLLLFTFFSACAQIDVKINPIGTLFMRPDLIIEVGITKKISIEPYIGYNNYKALTFGENKPKYTGFDFGLTTKYYLSPEESKRKFFAGFYGRYKDLSSNFTSGLFFYHEKLAAGIIFGGKRCFKERIVVGLDWGVGYAIINNYKDTNLDEFFVDFDMPLRILLGYRLRKGKHKFQ